MTPRVKLKVGTRNLWRILLGISALYFMTMFFAPFRLSHEDSSSSLDRLQSSRHPHPLLNPPEVHQATSSKVQQQNHHHLADYRLEFLHIPKCGGTLIEVIAKEHGVSWGACKFLPSWRLRPNSKSHLKDCPKLIKPQFQCKEALWHYPIPLLHSKFPSFRVEGYDPYDNLPPSQQQSPKERKFFAVIRNPYSWFISLYSMCPPCSRRESLSEYVHAYFKRTNPVNYCQYEFLYNISSPPVVVDDDKHHHHHQGRIARYSKRIVEPQMVVRMESLKDELEALWARHGYTDWKVPLREERDVNKRKNKKKLSVHNFTKSALEMIHEKCRLDFAEGPYDFVDLTDWPQQN